MKCYPFSVSLFLLIPLSLCAQGNQPADKSWCSLTLELKKPSGEIDYRTYFVLTVTNNMDEDIALVPGGNGERPLLSHSFLLSQRMRYDGKIDTSRLDACFIYRTPVLKIDAHTSYKTTIPLKMQIEGINYRGILPSATNSKYAKVRAGIKNFTLLGLKSRQVKVFTQYSNWIDISGEDFSKLGG